MQSCFIKSVFSPRSFSDQRKCNPLVAAAGIAAGSQLLGSLFSSGANKKLVRETNAQNREMFEQQMAQQARQFQMSQDYMTMDWNRNRQAALEDWYRETEYNDPLKQKERYINAGINPALAMQGQNQAIGSMESTAGGSSPSPGGMPGIPQMQAPVDTVGEAISNSLSTYLNARISQEQVRQLEIDNSHRDQQYIEQLLNLRADTSAKLAGVAKDSALRKIYDRQLDLLDEELFFVTQNRDLRLRQSAADTAVAEHTSNNLLYQARINRINAALQEEFGRDMILSELQERGANISVLRESVSKIIADTKLSQAQAENQVSQAAKNWLEANDLNPNSERGKQILELLKKQVRQAGADYWNPFNYVGKALGGSVGATKLIK